MSCAMPRHADAAFLALRQRVAHKGGLPMRFVAGRRRQNTMPPDAAG